MNSRKLTALLVVAFALLVIAGTKVSQLTRTRSLQSTSRFMVSTQDATSGRWSSRYITAPDLATNLGTWITNSGSGGSGTGEVTTVQLLAASNAVWTAQSAKAPTNNALIGPTSSSGVALTLAARAGQDGNMLNVKDSSGAIIFAIAYDGQLVGVGANSARLASTSTAGEVWTASDTTGIGAFTSIPQQTNSSIVRQTQLTASSNALVSILTSYDTTTSNGLYSLILGGGITANTATNIAQYFATNASLVTSNQLVSTLAPKASPTFTGSVTLSSGTANELVAFDASKVLVPVTGVSATEAGYLDGVTSLIQNQLNAKGLLTNANQFGASATLAIKDGALLTNTTIYGSVTQLSSTASPSSLSLYETNGTKYSQILAPNVIQTNNVLILPTNATAGVMVTQPAGTGTNQLAPVQLSAGQYATFNGTAYVASNLPAAYTLPSYVLTNNQATTVAMLGDLAVTDEISSADLRVSVNAGINTLAITNSIIYTPVAITGVGGANTNFTLLATQPEVYINGFTNVSIRAVMGYDSSARYWTCVITNGSGSDRMIEFSAVTNRYRFNGNYGTNAPSTLTNNTTLEISGRQVGTNVFIAYGYFAWP